MDELIHTLETDLFRVSWATINRLCRQIPSQLRSNPRSCEQFAEKVLIENLFGSDITFIHTESGRPSFIPAINWADAECPPISISHGAGIVALAVSKSDCLIGVDVEEPRLQLLRIYPRFLRSEEQPPEITVTTLLPLWTAKEAAWKASSTQPPSLIDIHLDKFDIHHHPIHPNALLTVAIPL